MRIFFCNCSLWKKKKDFLYVVDHLSLSYRDYPCSTYHNLFIQQENPKKLPFFHVFINVAYLILFLKTSSATCLSASIICTAKASMPKCKALANILFFTNNKYTNPLNTTNYSPANTLLIMLIRLFLKFFISLLLRKQENQIQWKVFHIWCYYLQKIFLVLKEFIK